MGLPVAAASLRKLLLVGLCAGLVTLPSWSPASKTAHWTAKDSVDVERALKNAYGSLLEVSSFELDEAWLLRDYLLPVYPDGALAAKVESEVPRLSQRSGYGLLLDPGQPRPTVPHHLPDADGARLLSYMYSTFGTPESLALARTRQFVSEPGREYVLTHQVLVLVAWRDTGRSLPEDLVGRMDELMLKLKKEQAKDTEWSDIYAERAAFIVTFGREPCPEGLEQWTKTAMAAQEADGSFGNHPWTWRYGRTRQEVSRPSHTTVLAAAVLVAYLRCSKGNRQGEVPWPACAGC
jgi:hypothetical protein